MATVLELLESAEVSLEDKGEVLREWFQDSNGRTQALLSLTPQNIVLLLPLCDVVVQRQVLQRIPKERREILPDVLRGLHPGAFQSNWKHFDVDTLRGILSACNPLEAAVLLGLENKEQFRNWFAKVNAVDRVKLLKLAMPILKALPEELVLSDAEDTAGASEAPSLNSTLVKAEEILPSLTGDETREDASRVTASGPEAPPLEGRNLHPPPHGPLSFPKNSTFSYVEHGTNSSSTAHINKAGPRITGPPVFRPSPSATPSAHDEDPEDPDYAPGLSPSVEESATAGRRSLVSLHSKGSRSSTQASGSGRSVSKLPTQPRPHYRPYPSGLFVSEALQTRLPTQPGPFSSSPTENAPLISCTEKTGREQRADLEYNWTKLVCRKPELCPMAAPPPAAVGHLVGDLYVHMDGLEGVARQCWTWCHVDAQGTLGWVPVRVKDLHPARQEYVLWLRKKKDPGFVSWIKLTSARAYMNRESKE